MQQGINPLALAYSTVEGVEAIAAPNIIIIAGRCNLNDKAFQRARVKGAELWEYRNVVEASTSKVCSLDDEFYMGSAAKCPRWPYPSPGVRWLWKPTHTMTDLRSAVGHGPPVSGWPNFAIDYLGQRMRAGQSDGFFLDVIGGRPWGESDWENWPDWEKQEWNDGVYNFMRRLDEQRRAINPGFKINNNNTWQYNERCTPFVDGITLEHTKRDNTYTVNWAGKTFGNLGQRRVLVVARAGDTEFWKGVPGVTHIGEVASADYGKVQPFTVPYAHMQQQDLEKLAREQPPPAVADCSECEESLKTLEAENATLRSTLDQIHTASAPPAD
jgi:hypothetical protein